MRRAAWVVCLLFPGCGAPSEAPAPAGAGGPSSPPASVAAFTGPPSGSVIGRIQWQKGLITITSSPRGPLFSVTDEEGQRVASNLTSRELSERFPAAAPLLQSVASRNALDARVERRVVREVESRQRLGL